MNVNELAVNSNNCTVEHHFTLQKKSVDQIVHTIKVFQDALEQYLWHCQLHASTKYISTMAVIFPRLEGTVSFLRIISSMVWGFPLGRQEIRDCRTGLLWLADLTPLNHHLSLNCANIGIVSLSTNCKRSGGMHAS